MLYKKLANLYEELSSTTKRLEKTEILSKFLEDLSKYDKDVMYLLLGEIYPEYDERKIGISNQLAIKALSKSTGTDSEKIVKEWRKLGDIGLVAEKLTKHKTQSTLQSHVLTTEKVIINLRKLPELEGHGTVNKKLALITELLTSASAIEAKYLTRTLLRDLRMGVQESTIKDALAKTFFDSDKDSKEIIKKAIDKSNDIGIVFLIAKKEGLEGLKKISLQVGKPTKVMLAQKVTDIEKGFEKVGKPCAIEYKYDGFRLLIHKKEDKITLFTRSLENVTKQFPEAVKYIKKYVKGDSFILDAEAVGFDYKTKEYKPFQEISQRIRRKYNIEELQKKLPIEVNVFDIIYYNGKSIIDEPFEKRTKIIKKIIKEKPYKIIPSKQIITDDLEKAEKFYLESLEDKQEGVMMKNLYASYNPGSRVGHMLKIKPEEKDLDLVIVGGEYGTGKRSGWISSFILACKSGDDFLEIGKVGTGIKEKTEQGVSFEELTNLVKPYVTDEKGRSVKINPKIVVSITYQEIQKSTNYNSGFALRFPRFVALRPDKSLKEVNTLEEIKQDYKNQSIHKK